MSSSRRTARAGRVSAGSRARDGPSDGRRSSNESGRSSGPKPGDQAALWIGLVGAAVVILIILLIGFSGGRRRPPPKAPKPRPKPVVRTVRRDWRQVGFNRGLDWKKVMTRRRMEFTRAKARKTAQLMTSDYARKGISGEGEKAFVRGFMQAVFGE